MIITWHSDSKKNIIWKTSLNEFLDYQFMAKAVAR
jgi:hypothetical protein